MIIAFDTYYHAEQAHTVCISFENWENETIKNIFKEITLQPEAYHSGAFYKRELPCILSLLQQVNLSEIDTILVDGFVFLDDQYRPGLGARLYQSLQSKIPVIGVAKSNFTTVHRNKMELLRGKSRNPLYVSAIGMDLTLATLRIKNMNGPFRIPNLLKKLDSLTRLPFQSIN